jgi:hypothetical protein
MRYAYRCILLLLFPIVLPAQTDQQIANVEHQTDFHWGTLGIAFSSFATAITPNQAAQLERNLAARPDDSRTRIRLINFYFHENLPAQRSASIFWLITHHPESPILGWDICRIVPEKPLSSLENLAQLDIAAMIGNYQDGDYATATALWDAVLARYPLPAEALHNAARFFMISDPDKTAHVIARLEQTDPGHAKLITDYRTKIAPALARR